MKSAFIFASALVLLMAVSAVPVSAAESGQVTTKVLFNDNEISGADYASGGKLKIGEPAEVKLRLFSIPA